MSLQGITLPAHIQITPTVPGLFFFFETSTLKSSYRNLVRCFRGGVVKLYTLTAAQSCSVEQMECDDTSGADRPSVPVKGECRTRPVSSVNIGCYEADDHYCGLDVA